MYQVTKSRITDGQARLLSTHIKTLYLLLQWTEIGCVTNSLLTFYIQTIKVWQVGFFGKAANSRSHDPVVLNKHHTASSDTLSDGFSMYVIDDFYESTWFSIHKNTRVKKRQILLDTQHWWLMWYLIMGHVPKLKLKMEICIELNPIKIG